MAHETRKEHNSLAERVRFHRRPVRVWGGGRQLEGSVLRDMLGGVAPGLGRGRVME